MRILETVDEQREDQDQMGASVELKDKDQTVTFEEAIEMKDKGRTVTFEEAIEVKDKGRTVTFEEEDVDGDEKVRKVYSAIRGVGTLDYSMWEGSNLAYHK